MACQRCTTSAVQHDHGPCTRCAYYAAHRPGDPHWLGVEACLHERAHETHVLATGPKVVWLTPLIQNADYTCPWFVRALSPSATRMEKDVYDH